MKRIFFGLATVLLASIFMASCCNCGKTARSAGKIWSNPEINMAEDPRIESVSDQEDAPDGSFFQRMNELFAESAISEAEAHSVYEKLFANGTFKNEAVGMPSPDDDFANETLEEFKNRVALRKGEKDSSYEFFLLKTGCGYSYYHGQITVVEDSKEIVVNIFERIHFSVPC